MTEQQARKLIDQVQQEFSDQILTRLDRSRQAENGSSWVVKLEYAGRILTAYKADDWLSIKWAWGLEDAVKQAPVHYLVDGIPMKIECVKGQYWYGRYQIAGKTVRKYLGRVDPRPVLDVYKKEEVAI